MLMKKTAILFVIVGVSFCSANSNLMSGLMDIVDQAEEKKDEEVKVLNNAFKQRMISQRIARDTLLISMDFKPTLYQKNIKKDADDFNAKFENLMNSNEEIKVVVKKLPLFQEKVDNFKRTWLLFYKDVKKLEKEKTNRDAINSILDKNMEILKDIDYIFSNFLKFYQSSDTLEKSMAHIKIMLFTQVGKPRMYSAKIVKERLLIKENIDKKENQQTLQKSIKEMDRLMKALKDGDKGLELNGTEDREILEKLAVSQALWEELKILVEKKTISKKEIEELIQKNDAFIEAHSKVVKLTRSSNDN
jgi:hypothetical protein